MRRLGLLLFLALSCNPAPRCRVAEDCPARAVCSGGFCADGPVPNDRESPIDLDGPDSGTAGLQPEADGGVLDDGRDAG